MPTLTGEASDALLIVRLRHQSRTYWMLADRGHSRTYAPHVSQRAAIALFEQETGRTHANHRTFADHRTPAAAQELIARVLRGEPA